jgi:hypothetical protein
MGKNWKGHGGGRGGGGGSGDLTSCRGFAGVIGTCDAAREKESNKELTNLLQQTIERIYPVVAEDSIDSPQESDSIADMIKSEVAQLKSKKQGGGQDVVSINTGIKGIVFVKISRRDICPVKLIKAIFDQVKADKVPCTRHVVRIIPLQLAFLVQFKARNHNTLTKNGVLQKLRECMPPHVRQNYMDAQVGGSAV